MAFLYSCVLAFGDMYDGSHLVPLVKSPKPEIRARKGQTKVTVLILQCEAGKGLTTRFKGTAYSPIVHRL